MNPLGSAPSQKELDRIQHESARSSLIQYCQDRPTYHHQCAGRHGCQVRTCRLHEGHLPFGITRSSSSMNSPSSERTSSTKVGATTSGTEGTGGSSIQRPLSLTYPEPPRVRVNIAEDEEEDYDREENSPDSSTRNVRQRISITSQRRGRQIGTGRRPNQRVDEILSQLVNAKVLGIASNETLRDPLFDVVVKGWLHMCGSPIEDSARDTGVKVLRALASMEMLDDAASAKLAPLVGKPHVGAYLDYARQYRHALHDLSSSEYDSGLLHLSLAARHLTFGIIVVVRPFLRSQYPDGPIGVFINCFTHGNQLLVNRSHYVAVYFDEVLQAVYDPNMLVVGWHEETPSTVRGTRPDHSVYTSWKVYLPAVKVASESDIQYRLQERQAISRIAFEYLKRMNDAAWLRRTQIHRWDIIYAINYTYPLSTAYSKLVQSYGGSHRADGTRRATTSIFEMGGYMQSTPAYMLQTTVKKPTPLSPILHYQVKRYPGFIEPENRNELARITSSVVDDIVDGIRRIINPPSQEEKSQDETPAARVPILNNDFDLQLDMPTPADPAPELPSALSGENVPSQTFGSILDDEHRYAGVIRALACLPRNDYANTVQDYIRDLLSELRTSSSNRQSRDESRSEGRDIQHLQAPQPRNHPRLTAELNSMENRWHELYDAVYLTRPGSRRRYARQLSRDLVAWEVQELVERQINEVVQALREMRPDEFREDQSNFTRIHRLLANLSLARYQLQTERRSEAELLSERNRNPGQYSRY